MKRIINYNGSHYEHGRSAIATDDHSYRYGDGLFETLRIDKGSILLKDYHFKRLFSGLELLKFHTPALFTEQKIVGEIKQLCKKNNCEELARVRFSVSRGNGGLYDCDNKFSYLIECWPLARDISNFNDNGLVIDIFPDARKSIDVFSNLKSANYLPYVMAAVWAGENKLDEALILNQHDRICDATIANIFWIKDHDIFTPPLSEGCIAGVMRSQILNFGPDNFREQIPDVSIQESELTEHSLLEADEVFLSNVISGIRWVKQCRHKIYRNSITHLIFPKLLQTISS